MLFRDIYLPSSRTLPWEKMARISSRRQTRPHHNSDLGSRNLTSGACGDGGVCGNCGDDGDCDGSDDVILQNLNLLRNVKMRPPRKIIKNVWRCHLGCKNRNDGSLYRAIFT